MRDVCEKAALSVTRFLDLAVRFFQRLEHAVDGSRKLADLVVATRAPHPPGVVVAVGYLRCCVRQARKRTHRASHPQPRHKSHRCQRDGGPRNEYPSESAKDLIERAGGSPDHDITLKWMRDDSQRIPPSEAIVFKTRSFRSLRRAGCGWARHQLMWPPRKVSL
jgi:hypothetical protein